MRPSLPSIITALPLSCSSPQSITQNTPIQPHSIQNTLSSSYSPAECWQSFQPYLFDDDLYRASARFKPTTTTECYEYATQKAAIKKSQALREKTIERYQESILQYENNPHQPYIDELCKAQKEKMKQSYDLISSLWQIYQDAAVKTENQFPWIKSSPDYQIEKQHFHDTLNALSRSLDRPYCDSNEFEADIKNIK